MRCTVAAIDIVTESSRPALALASARASSAGASPAAAAAASSFFISADSFAPVFACCFSRVVSVSIRSSIA